jgi:hypothetical protein
MNTFLGLLANLFATHESATAGNWFISYGHDDQVTAAFSSFCDLRIVWGGDETVRRIRAIPLNAHAAERAFASKRSISVLRTAAYLAADEVVRNKLADAMATDVIPFAQMACSSPHQVFWIGKVEDAAEAIVDFHQRLDCAICRRGANQEISHAVRRFNAAFALAASGQAAKVEFSARATSVVAASPEKSEQEIPCGAGLLLNASCTTWEEVRQLLRAEHQTVTHFGFTTGELQDMAWTAGIRGVDRLVPVGRALDFTPIWDGFSLWTDLTRSVVIR